MMSRIFFEQQAFLHKKHGISSDNKMSLSAGFFADHDHESCRMHVSFLSTLQRCVAHTCFLADWRQARDGGISSYPNLLQLNN
jgi:hypothetical protein